MAEPTGSGTHVDAIEQHCRGREVAKVVQPDLRNVQPGRKARERERGVVRSPRRQPIRVVAEDVAIGLDGALGGSKLAELRECDRVKRETTFCMGLRRSLNRSGRGVCDLAGDVQRAPVDVDVFPLQRTQLTPTGDGDPAIYMVFRGAPGRNRTYDLRFRNAVEMVSASLLESHLTCSPSVFSSSGLVEHHAVTRSRWTSGWTNPTSTERRVRSDHRRIDRTTRPVSQARRRS